MELFKIFMAITEGVYNTTIKHAGYFKFSDLYAMIFDWLKNKKYDVSEETYEEKAGGSKEILIKWKAVKKVTDYFKYEIVVKWHILQMKDAEVEIDGKLTKTNNGKLKLTISSSVIRDYDGTWESKPFWVMARKIYEKYLIKANVGEYEDKLIDDSSSMVDNIKAYLQLSSN